MIKTVIVEPQKRYKSFTPYWRNDLVLNRELGIPIVNGRFDLYKGEKIANIIISYASFWADYEEIGQFLKDHPESTVYRILNEYNNCGLNGDLLKIVPNSAQIWIANFTPKRKDIKASIALNLNTLILEDRVIQVRRSQEKRYQIIYYGMYRAGRETYFRRYFDENMMVSTSEKNVLLFKTINPRMKFMKPFYWGENSTLELFQYSLYIEDEYTHANYNFPANRFYEALIYGTVLLIDRNCKNTFDTAGYDVSDYYIDDKRSLKAKMKSIDGSYGYHLKRQRGWLKKAKDERVSVLSRLKEIFC